VIEVSDEALAGKFVRVMPHLDERQRRLVLGAEALMLGYGGIRGAARAAGVDEDTVSRGAREVEDGAQASERVRAVGGGRKSIAKKDPGIVAALLALVEPDERGDPESPLRWTTKSLRKLAAELAACSHGVGPDTVAALLREQGFTLQGVSRVLEGVRHPDRDAQFRYINTLAGERIAAGEPVVSVDAKKKEALGEYAVIGREWHPKGRAVPVRSHDFPEKNAAKAVPYGIYDLAANTGWVSVGCDGDTAEFAVAVLRRWWRAEGEARYPGATRLLVTADAGGANGYRVRAWKKHLAAFAAEQGLTVTVCHFPPGTSKWNKIEHRLFSYVSINLRGRPVTSYEVLISVIGATTTATGLRVHAELDAGAYPTGEQVHDKVMKQLPVDRHEWHGEWNYDIRPAAPPVEPAPLDPVFGRFERGDKHPGWLTHPSVTGIEAPAFAGLLERYTAHLTAHPASAMPDSGKPTVWTGTRKLSPTDRLLATVITLRWRVPRPVLARLFGVVVMTVSSAIRQTTADLTELGITIPKGAMAVKTADQLASIAGHKPAT
jgi:hypothetical protein